MPEVSCYQNDDVRTTNTEEDYQEEMEEACDASAEVSGNFGGASGAASFSASSGAQAFTQEIATTTDTRYSVVSFCTRYKVAFATFTDWSKQIAVPDLQFIAPNLVAIAGMVNDTDPACKAIEPHDLVPICKVKDDPIVAKCPQTCGLALWFGIFEEYGTHFLSTVHLGGKRVTETIISESLKETIEKSGSSAESAVAASAKYEGVAGGGKQ